MANKLDLYKWWKARLRFWWTEGDNKYEILKCL